MASFDLFRNPFVLLGVDLSASAEEVAEAFEEAVTQGRYSETDLTAARQALLRPLLRLQAEVSSLLDTPRREWRTILTALRHSRRIPEFQEALAKIPALSRSNILAQFASRTPSDASVLIGWVNAGSEIRPDVVHSELERLRKAAALAPPERAAVVAALSELREQHSRVLFEGFINPSDAIEAVTACAERVTSAGNEDNIAALSSLLNAYHRHIEQELSFRRERIKATGAELQADPDGPGNLAIVIDALKFWNTAAKPLQLLEAHKSRSEPHSQAVFQEIRSVAIDLANDRSRFDVALSLTKACQIEFSDLPRASEQLAEDEKALQDRVAAAKIEPLMNALTKLDNERTLLVDLQKYGFGKAAAGFAKSLRSTFISVVNDSKGSSAEEIPWIMLRSAAVKLNNEREDPESALALIQGLLEISRELNASNEVITRLPEDKRAVERNRLERELVGHLEANRSRDALSAIENLLRDYKNPEERETLQKLKWQLERKRTGKYLRWGFWAAVVGGIIILANVDHSSSPAPQTSSYSYAQPAAPSPIRTLAEEMPPVGTGRQFDEANIRYCKFQNARLQFIKSRIVTNFQIDAFNRLVDDYNSRCSSFKYWQSDWSEVESELAQKQTELEEQAEDIINGWSIQR